MTLTFFGIRKSFSYDQIGGTDSFFRRLANELATRDINIEFIHYGYEQNTVHEPTPNLVIREFRTFREALRYMRAESKIVFVNAIKSSDRLAFIRFRFCTRKKIQFYMTYSLFSESAKGRFLHFLEALIYPYQPGVLCMSQRLTTLARQYRQHAQTLLPPVPSSYFLKPEDKPVKTQKVVAYIGRLEAGKGAFEAISILEKLSNNPNIITKVFGYEFNLDAYAKLLRDRIVKNGKISYKKQEHNGWYAGLDEEMAEELKNIDFLLLPYHLISSSIDTPLLLLEGMASLCCILAPPLGDIEKIYGESKFLITNENFTSQACALILASSSDSIAHEQDRIYRQNQKINYDSKSIADKLLKILEDH